MAALWHVMQRSKMKGWVLMKPPKKLARKRDAVATRQVILTSARKLFLEIPYEHLGLRDIAAQANVNVALIGRYFGSKQKLFQEVCEHEFHPEGLLVGPRETFGKRMVELVAGDADQRALRSIKFALMCLSSPGALPLLRRYRHDRFVKPFAQWLGGQDAEVRANIISAILLGATVNHSVSSDTPLAGTKLSKYSRALGDAIQHYVDGV